MFAWILIFVLLGLYSLACMFLIFVILIQSGKGGGLSSLGSASSGLTEALGATGAEKTLNKLTTWAAVGFMVLGIMLSLVGKHTIRGTNRTILGETPKSTQTAPQTPVGAPPGREAPAGIPVPGGPADVGPAAPAPIGPSAPMPSGPGGAIPIGPSAPAGPGPGGAAPATLPPAPPAPAR